MAQSPDPYLWLEEVESPKALSWVRERNAVSEKLLSARPEYAPAREGILKILDSKEKIPSVGRVGDYFYNFWQDADNKRGLLRRTTLAEYKKQNPAWEIVLDLDALAKTEKGVVNLTAAVFDRGYGTNTINWRLDANNNYSGPIIEPFDQQQPLTHFDVFVRRNRMVLFVNGRQAHCWDISQRPLTMSAAQIVYGQVLYHSDAEVIEQFFPQRGAENIYRPPAGSFYYSLNAVAADHRAWDAVGHSEKIEIPALFKFDEALCKRPGSIEAR